MNTNEVELRPDNPDKDPVENWPIKDVDEILIGNFFHLERMSGTNSRSWCLIITDEKGEQLNITINEKDGKVSNAFIYEDNWSRPYCCDLLECPTHGFAIAEK